MRIDALDWRRSGIATVAAVAAAAGIAGRAVAAVLVAAALPGDRAALTAAAFAVRYVVAIYLARTAGLHGWRTSSRSATPWSSSVICSAY
jgi:hypothetical protein